MYTILLKYENDIVWAVTSSRGDIYGAICKHIVSMNCWTPKHNAIHTYRIL